MTAAIVSLWSTDLDTGEIDLSVLSNDETLRASRFRSEQDKARYLVARAWLRLTLARYTDETAERLQFSYGEFGKPLVTYPDASLQFSLTHSGPMARLAVTHHRPIGIDVELMRPGAYDQPSASLVLSPIEREFIDGSPDPDFAFLRCWTRKEAFAKVDGRGLERDLVDITLTSVDGQPLRVDGYKVVDFPVQGGMGAAAMPLDHKLRTK